MKKFRFLLVLMAVFSILALSVGVVAAQDGDGDGIADDVDVCPNHADPLQTDTDGDGVGDACEGALQGTATDLLDGTLNLISSSGIGILIAAIAVIGLMRFVMRAFKGAVR